MKCPHCGQPAHLRYQEEQDDRAVVVLDCPSCKMRGVVATTDRQSNGNQFTREALQRMVHDETQA